MGGRWHREALRFVHNLVTFRARRAPLRLRASAAEAWARRWWGLLSVAGQDAVAASLLIHIVVAAAVAETTRSTGKPKVEEWEFW